MTLQMKWNWSSEKLSNSPNSYRITQLESCSQTQTPVCLSSELNHSLLLSCQVAEGDLMERVWMEKVSIDEYSFLNDSNW